MDTVPESILSLNDILFTTTQAYLATFAAFVPNIIGSLIIFIIGLIFASILREATKKALDWTGFTRSTNNEVISNRLKRIGLHNSLTTLAASLVYWSILLIFLSAVFDALGLNVVVVTLNQLIEYLPRVVGAAITLVLAMILGRFTRGFINAGLRELNVPFGSIVGGTCEVLIILFAATIAAAQLGLEVSIITTNVTVIIAGAVAFLVLSLGLGWRTAAGNLISGYYVKDMIKTSSMARLAGHTGKVKEINSIAVILESTEGDIIIPHEIILKHGSLSARDNA